MTEKTIISTENAPSAIGTYSQAVKAGNTVYISGQIPLNPKTMEMVTESFEAQAVQVFDNLKAIAEGITVEELQAKTASPLVVEGDIEVMAPPAL